MGEEYLNTIIKNLETAMYIPGEESEDKEYGYSLVLSLLYEQNNANASRAADRLLDYALKKYTFENLLVDPSKQDIFKEEAGL